MKPVLKNTHGLLVKTGENTHVSRQIRFTDLQQIIDQEAALKACIQQAIAVEKAGLKVDVTKTAAPKIPVELQNKFKALPALKAAYEALTPGRQRAYIYHFSGAKQSATRESRIEKHIPHILEGRGLNE